jgi:hypothetical protein
MTRSEEIEEPGGLNRGDGARTPGGLAWTRYAAASKEAGAERRLHRSPRTSRGVLGVRSMCPGNQAADQRY